MCAVKTESIGQAGLAGFGAGKVVKLDGGKRLRLDDRVDFWPGSQNWQTVQDGPDGTTSGVGVAGMLAFLKRVREAEGRPVAVPAPRKSKRQVICDHCGRPAEFHGGTAMYPDRKDLEDRQFWVCWPCDAWVGCQRDSDVPFGALANEELRAARIAAHAAFDPVWQNGLMSRSEAHQWLAGGLGIALHECRIGRMPLGMCWRVRDAVWERFGSDTRA